MIKYCIILLIFGATLLSSCKNNQQELDELAAISAKVKVTQNLYNTIDISLTKGKVDSLNHFFNRLKEVYVPTKIVQKEAMAMNALKVYRRFFRKAPGKYRNFGQDLASSERNCKALKEDIENKRGNKAEYKANVLFEKNKIKQIASALVEYKTEMDSALYYFDKNTAFMTQVIAK